MFGEFRVGPKAFLELVVGPIREVQFGRKDHLAQVRELLLEQFSMERVRVALLQVLQPIADSHFILIAKLNKCQPHLLLTCVQLGVPLDVVPKILNDAVVHSPITSAMR